MALRIPTAVSTVRPPRSTGMGFRSIAVPDFAQTFGTGTENPGDAAVWGEIAAGGKQLAAVVDAEHKQDVKDAQTLALLTTQNTGDAAARVITDDEAARLGRNAGGGIERARAELDKLEAQLREGTEDLTEPGKIALERYILGLRNKVLNAVTTHERQQRHAAMVEEIDVSLSNSVTEGARQFLNSEALQGQLLVLAQQSKNRAEMTMVPGSDEAEALAEKIYRENASKMYDSAINRALRMEDKLYGVARGKQLFDEAKAAGLLSNEALDRLEGVLNTTATDQRARAWGIKLLEDHGQDSKAAVAAVEAMNISDPEKDAIRVRYQFERAQALAARDLAYAERLKNFYKIAMGGDGAVPIKDLDTLDSDDRRAVEAVMDYHEKEKQNNNKTDPVVLAEWDAMGVDERGVIKSADFLKKYASKVSNTAGERDKMIEEWETAVERVRGEDNSVKAIAAQHARTEDNAARKQNRVDFGILVDARKDMFWDKDQIAERAAFNVAVWREFSQRAEPGVLTGSGIRPPLTTVEMDEIIKTASWRISFAGENVQVFDVMADVVNSKGELVGKSMGGKEDWAKELKSFAKLEERDRFEVIQWYRRENADAIASDETPSGESKKPGQIDAESLNAWIFKTVFLGGGWYLLPTDDGVAATGTQPAIPSTFDALNITLDDLGMEKNAKNRQDLYRRYLIHKKGG